MISFWCSSKNVTVWPTSRANLSVFSCLRVILATKTSAQSGGNSMVSRRTHCWRMRELMDGRLKACATNAIMELHGFAPDVPALPGVYYDQRQGLPVL